MTTTNNELMNTEKVLKPITDKDFEILAKNYLQYSNAKLSPLNAQRFIVKCVINKLNPYTGDVIAYESGGNLVCITTYQKYLQTASTCPGRCGERFTEHYDKDGNLVAVTCTVSKYVDVASTIVPEFLTFTARMNEYSTGKSVWLQKPSVMLRKCAHVNALRQAYPNEFKDMPYSREEIDDLAEQLKDFKNDVEVVEHKLTNSKKRIKKNDERLTELAEENNNPEVVMVEQLPPHAMPNTNDFSEQIELKFNGDQVEERVMHQQEVAVLNQQQQTTVDNLEGLSPELRKTVERYANDPLTIEYFKLLWPFTKSELPPALSTFFAEEFNVTGCLQISQFSNFSNEDKQKILSIIKSILN